MKNTASFFLSIVLIAFTISSCRLCNECNDTKITKINRTDTSKPTIQWSFSSARTTAGAATSSIAIVTDPSAGVDANVAADLSYGIYAEATDNESGIKSIKMSGGFSNTCRNGVNLFSAHGTLGEQRQDFSFTNCALKSWNLNDLKIERYTDCGTTNTLVNGNLACQVIAENFAGLKDTSVLVVRFRPVGL
jgi:hypothetical protein